MNELINIVEVASTAFPIVMESNQNGVKEKPVYEYESRLLEASIHPVYHNGFLYVGECTATQGWIIDISSIPVEIEAMLVRVLPMLKTNGWPFRVIPGKDYLGLLLSGRYGQDNIGKVISIYTPDDGQAAGIAKQLIPLLEGLNGPNIPTDKNLGGIVYTRYGSFGDHYIAMGKTVGYSGVKDNMGDVQSDPLSIPFAMPPWLTWPYVGLIPLSEAKQPKLLNYAYKLSSVIKHDIKGKVYKGFYFRKAWSIRACIIKEGKRYMFADEDGRDIRDRLKWQYDIYQALKNEIAMPEIFDYFEENDNTYLAMRFIKGRTLLTIVEELYIARSWKTLPLKDKISLVDYLLVIVNQVERIHRQGYIHRDITPANFLIQGNDEIYLIDLELAWDKKRNLPSKPFQLGTFGYMSPEQQALAEPDYADDCYALGGLMVWILTCFPPNKFNPLNIDALKESLRLLHVEESMIELISQCLTVPSQRIGLEKIKIGIEKFKQHIQSGGPGYRNIPYQVYNGEATRRSIECSIKGLALPFFSSNEGYWVSEMENNRETAHEQKGMTILPAFRNGITGVLYILAVAKQAGYDITTVIPQYQKNWAFLFNKMGNNDLFPTGLNKGVAGIALALAEGIKAGLIQDSPEQRQLLKSLLEPGADGIEFSSGLTGLGLAILHCLPYLEPSWAEEKLSGITQQILTSQLKNGSWHFNKHGIDKKTGIVSFQYGIAGITTFLLQYMRHFKEMKVFAPAQNGLHYLEQDLLKQSLQIGSRRGLNRGFYTAVSLDSGIPGKIIPLILSDQLTGDNRYRQVIEKIIDRIPTDFNLSNFSLGQGLSGLGYMYSLAYKATGKEEYFVQANRINALLLSSKKQASSDMEYWMVYAESNPTTSLFTGNTGIIAFQLEFNTPNTMPLFPWYAPIK